MINPKKTKNNKSFYNVLQLSSASITVKILSILVLAFYTRYLTKEELSLIPFFSLIGGMSTLFFNFGIYPTFIKLIPSMLNDDYEKARSIMITGASIILLGNIIFSIVTFVYSKNISIIIFHHSSYIEIIKLMSLGCFFQGIRQISNNILWCTSRFNLMSIIMVIESITTIIFSVTLLYFFGIIGLVVGLVFGGMVSSIVSVYFLKDILFYGKLKFYSAKKLIKKSLPFYLENYLMYFRSDGDQWIVATFLGPKSLAIYYIARKLCDTLTKLFESYNKVITISLSNLRKDKNNFEEKIQQVFSINAYLLFPMIFLVIGLSPFLINLIAGSEYNSSIVPAIILCLVVMVRVFWRPTIGRSVFLLKPAVSRVKLTFFESIILILFLVIFTPLFNVVGVAFARLIPSILVGIYAYFIVKDSIKITIPVKEIITVSIASLLMGMFILMGQYLYFNCYMMPIYVFIGMLGFFVIVSIRISEQYYSQLSSVLPFKIKDPIRLFISKIAKTGEYYGVPPE